jgi:hypothetical protein
MPMAGLQEYHTIQQGMIVPDIKQVTLLSEK